MRGKSFISVLVLSAVLGAVLGAEALCNGHLLGHNAPGGPSRTITGAPTDGPHAPAAGSVTVTATLPIRALLPQPSRLRPPLLTRPLRSSTWRPPWSAMRCLVRSLPARHRPLRKA